MVSKIGVGDKFFQWLMRIDEETRDRVVAKGCPRCGGRLDRGDYQRKPRGGLLALLGEAYCKRFSLCCSRRGCRRRAMPASVRFLGRRVYLGVVVVTVSVFYVQARQLLEETAAQQQKRAAAKQARRALEQAKREKRAAEQVSRETGIPRRTVRRWALWWQREYPQSRQYKEQQGRFVPTLATEWLPGCLMERFAAAVSEPTEALVRLLVFLSPLTTSSGTGGSCFLRE